MRTSGNYTLVQPGQQSTATASCAFNEKPLGGGPQFTNLFLGMPQYALTFSGPNSAQPIPGGIGWTINLTNTGTQDLYFAVFATCAKAD